MKKQEEAYHQGDNLLNRQLDDWYPQVKPIESGDFLQIETDLTSYYRNFQAYYQKNPKNNRQKLYPPAFYHLYFSKNVVK